MIYLTLIYVPFALFGQDSNFYVECPDSVAVGSQFKVTFVLENANGNIETPDFYGLKIHSGPNQSISTSIINGDTRQSRSIYFILVAEQEGSWVIERATVEVEGVYLETEPATIIVTEHGPKISKDLSISDRFELDDFFNRRINEKPELKKEKPKMSKRDSILKKYKVKKF